MKRIVGGLGVSVITVIVCLAMVEIAMRVVLPSDFRDAGQFKG